MLKNSFIFLDGIGSQLERKLWAQGIKDWDSFLNKDEIEGISRHRKLYYNRLILEAKKHTFLMNTNALKAQFPSSEIWRLYDFFREESVFLDIETDGLGLDSDITVFGLYDGLNSKTMIEGINLDYRTLKDELSKYKMIVTFNGASFDVPFIKRRYPGLIPNIPNFDVKCIAGRLGFKGGLKSIERQMGIKRKDIVQDFNGGDALTLWRMYRATGDEHYLNLLVEYNEFDIINLKLVAERCVRLMKESLLGI